MTVGEALAHAQAQGIERLDAMLLLAHHLDRRREWLIAHSDEAIGGHALSAFQRDCVRRADDVPLAYLIGRREFHGLDLIVTPAVLVPRPETELLADWAIEQLQEERRATRRPRVLDLGTGSGALALSIASACPWAEVHASDCSEAALEVAATNARRLDLPVAFACGSWWDAAGSGRFDLVVANPPYIATGDPHLSRLRYEPPSALVAGPTGLDALRQIISEAAPHLSGWLLLEHGWDQAGPARAMLERAGFQQIVTRRDLQGHPRCTGGRRD